MKEYSNDKSFTVKIIQIKLIMGEDFMILGLHHAQITIPKGAELEGKNFIAKFLVSLRRKSLNR